MKTLTVSQALAEGYKYCGSQGQELYDDIDGMEDEEFYEGREVLLAAKEAETLPLPPATYLLEWLAEGACDDLCEADLDALPKFLKPYEADFQAVLDKIAIDAEASEFVTTRKLTDIRLVPDPK